MQLTSLLRPTATAAVLLMLLTISFHKAHAQSEGVLYNFCSVGGCFDGAAPTGLTADSGNFYGTTGFGGASEENPNCIFGIGCGTIFLLSPEPAAGCESGSTPGADWCENVLYNFCQVNSGSAPCIDGSLPSGSVILVRTGTFAHQAINLYGTTASGGSNCGTNNIPGCGVVFELSPEPLPTGCPSGTNPSIGWCESVIYNFGAQADGSDGFFPTGSLVRDSAGNLYGAVYNGVFELSPNGSGGWKEALIYADTNNEVVGGLAMDTSGDLYGVDLNQTTGGGWGNVFKLTNSSGSWTASVIHAFNGSLVGTIPDGLLPYGTPAVDSVGNVYGTTGLGGSKNLGTVWKLTPVTTGTEAGTYKEKILHSFTSAPTGDSPEGGVTLDASGNIYGTAGQGGKYLTQCQNSKGVAVGCGTAFELVADVGATGVVTYKYKLLWNFDNTDGAGPGNLVLDSSGHVYGGAGGGPNGQGVIFEVNPLGAASTTTLTASPNPSIEGEAVTFTATVSSSAGTPPNGETVNFMDGLTLLGTGTLSGGSASFTTSALPVGASLVDAVYGGDLNFAPSTSRAIRQLVKE